MRKGFLAVLVTAVVVAMGSAPASANDNNVSYDAPAPETTTTVPPTTAPPTTAAPATTAPPAPRPTVPPAAPATGGRRTTPVEAPAPVAVPVDTSPPVTEAPADEVLTAPVVVEPVPAEAPVIPVETASEPSTTCSLCCILALALAGLLVLVLFATRRRKEETDAGHIVEGDPGDPAMVVPVTEGDEPSTETPAP